MVDASGVIDLGVGTIKTLKLGGSRVVPKREFERFLRDAGIVVEPAAAPEPEPTASARRGRRRQAAQVGLKGGV